MILYLLGRIMILEAGLMVPSVIISLASHDGSWWAFLVTMAFLVAVGIAISIRKPEDTSIYSREGLITVALAWVIISLTGAMPMFLSGAVPNYVDALFETASGFTTTGASALTSVEDLPRAVLFWRSFTHWVGGMGVLVLVLAILPISDDRSMTLMRAEVPGPIAGKLVPRMRKTAFYLYAVYTAMTLVLVVLLLFSGIGAFDSFCLAFGTAGTGGFAVTNAGVGGYNNAYVEIVISIFMLLFGINFNLYYLILIKRWREALRSEELHVFGAVVAFAVVTIAISIYGTYRSVGTSLRLALFQTASIISTTGFATADFNTWPVYAQCVLVVLMFIGGCAGSTGGGIKVSRVMILFKSAIAEIRHTAHPHAVTMVRVDGKRVDKATLTSVRNYLALYVFILALVTLLISAVDGQYDFATHFTAAVSCFNNIGPGLSAVGPYGNFAGYSAFSKIVLSFAMLAGRLEIYPIALLFSAETWRRTRKI